MQKKDREITEKEAIVAIIREAEVCRLGMCSDNIPYVVPMSFGYEDDVFYFHCASKGKKLDILSKNPKVCIEIDQMTELKEGGSSACKWGMNYKSVIASGTAEFIEDEAEKRHALDRIMAQYSEGKFEYKDGVVRKTGVFRVSVEKMSGKQAV